MKKTLTLVLLILVSSFISFAQNVGINTTGAAPDNSALLDLNSPDKGFLITRADTANIASPAFGLMTLAPIDSCLYMYSGIAWIGMGGGGSDCSCSCSGTGTGTTTPPTFPCDGTVIPVVDVTSTTGKVWMDRNLGAGQVATSSTDATAYGDLYQWGRCSDGHEKRTSGTTTTLSITDTPGHGDFITMSTGVADWRSPQNNNLWQGATGINNPCPTGYRIPTDPELEAELLTWTNNNAAGAFSSVLKLSVSGLRNANGPLGGAGNGGWYFSSTISGTSARNLYFTNSNAFVGNATRADALSVRCIKD